MQTETIYEQRLCAFIDILGFSALVKSSSNHPAQQRKIRKLLREVEWAQPVWERDPPLDIMEAKSKLDGAKDPKADAIRKANKYAADERGSTFSDSLILSAVLNDHAIIGFITSLLFLSQGVAELGMYVRGAVCLGSLYHDSDMCFGPALIDAYGFEKNAKYPRIVFTPEAYNEVLKVHSSGPDPLGAYFRMDLDGKQFLDFLNPPAFEISGPFRMGRMSDIRREVNKQLTASQVSYDVTDKILWFANYFNLSLSEAPIEGIDPLSIDILNTLENLLLIANYNLR